MKNFDKIPNKEILHTKIKEQLKKLESNTSGLERDIESFEKKGEMEKILDNDQETKKNLANSVRKLIVTLGVILAVPIGMNLFAPEKFEEFTGKLNELSNELASSSAGPYIAMTLTTVAGLLLVFNKKIDKYINKHY